MEMTTATTTTVSEAIEAQAKHIKKKAAAIKAQAKHRKKKAAAIKAKEVRREKDKLWRRAKRAREKEGKMNSLWDANVASHSPAKILALDNDNSAGLTPAKKFTFDRIDEIVRQSAKKRAQAATNIMTMSEQMSGKIMTISEQMSGKIMTLSKDDSKEAHFHASLYAEAADMKPMSLDFDGIHDEE
jgi:hypothetical protein